MASTKVLRVIVMDVIAVIMMQHAIQIIALQVSQRPAIIAINLQIHHGIKGNLITASRSHQENMPAILAQHVTQIRTTSGSLRV
jgi:hypothetical protein